MNSYRYLLTLLVIPFSLNTPVIQSMLPLDRNTALIVAGGTGLIVGITATYVLTKKHYENKNANYLLNAETMRLKAENTNNDVMQELIPMRNQLKEEQKKAERAIAALTFHKKGMLATEASFNNCVNLAKKDSILERLFWVMRRNKTNETGGQDQVHVSDLEVASRLIVLAGEYSSMDTHHEGCLQGLPVPDCAENNNVIVLIDK